MWKTLILVLENGQNYSEIYPPSGFIWFIWLQKILENWKFLMEWHKQTIIRSIDLLRFDIKYTLDGKGHFLWILKFLTKNLGILGGYGDERMFHLLIVITKILIEEPINRLYWCIEKKQWLFKLQRVCGLNNQKFDSKCWKRWS